MIFNLRNSVLKVPVSPVMAEYEKAVTETSRALIERLSPKSKNPQMQKLLERVSDLTSFENILKTPRSRADVGFAFDDCQFQEETQKLVDSGVIIPGTMVISNTGHDIPILAQLYKNPHLKFDFAFHTKFPKYVEFLTKY